MSKARKSKASSEAPAMDHKTMEEFKEVFEFMDYNQNGVIDKADLRDLYVDLGQMPSDSQIDTMLADAKGPLNFATFLNMFGSRMTGTDPENTVMTAIKLFDNQGTGFISDADFRGILKHPRGKPLTDDEIDSVYAGDLPIDDGQLDLNKFAALICGGGDDKPAAGAEA